MEKKKDKALRIHKTRNALIKSLSRSLQNLRHCTQHSTKSDEFRAQAKLVAKKRLNHWCDCSSCLGHINPRRIKGRNLRTIAERRFVQGD